jgi:DNA polymerase-3 subunit delta
MLPLLFNFFQNLMVVHYAPKRQNENDIAQALDMRSPWGARDYMAAMKVFSARKTMDIIGKLRETDAKSKGIGKGNTTDGELMKELVFFILH